ATQRAHDGRQAEPVRLFTEVRSQDAEWETLPTHREHEKRPVQAARRSRRRALGRAKRGVAARWEIEGGEGPAEGNPSDAGRSTAIAQEGRVKDRPPYLDDSLADPRSAPARALSEMERAEIEAACARHREHWDGVHAQLMLDAQACARAMQASPRLDGPADWQETAMKSLDDYHTGRSLMEHLGAARLLDPATTGMLLAIR